MSCSPPRSLRLPHVLVFAGVDVSVELLLRRLIALLGELHSLLYPLAGLSPYLLELILVERVVLDQPVLDHREGIALAPLFDLFLGAVLLEEISGAVRGRPVGDRLDGVGFTALPHLLGQSIGDLDDGLYVHAVLLLEEISGAVRGRPVGDRLDGVGFTALPHLLGQSIGDLDDGLYVHAVYLLVLDAVRVELGSEVSHAGGALDGGAHPVLVVLDDKQAGTLAVPSPEPREVGGFVEGALADRTVTEIELGDVVGLLVAHGVGDADAEGYMPADDAVAAHQAALDVEEVHGAALALYEARLLAVELCHDLFGITTQK